jgi:cytochrome c-type biogenesis protein CcmH/NrfF
MSLSARARAGLSLLAAGALLLTTTAPALAATRCPRTTELAIESKVMCQVCGVPLELASSPEADRERAFITTLVARCETVAQIETAMIAQYGSGIIATPGTSGFAITAWLVPGAAILLAAFGIASVIVPRRRRRRTEPSTPVGDPPSAAEQAQLDSVLAAYEARPTPEHLDEP